MDVTWNGPSTIPKSGMIHLERRRLSIEEDLAGTFVARVVLEDPRARDPMAAFTPAPASSSRHPPLAFEGGHIDALGVEADPRRAKPGDGLELTGPP